MEKVELKKQYVYSQNANLVLTVSDRKRPTGPTTEVTSLVGKLTPAELQRGFGQFVTHHKRDELKTRMEKAKKKRDQRDFDELAEQEEERRRKRRRTQQMGTVLSADVENVYRPKTRESRLAYEVLLSFIQGELTDSSHSVLRSYADEVLTVFKSEANDRDKKKQVEELLRRGKVMDEAAFHKLLNIAKNITDFSTSEEAAPAEEDTKIDEVGINVVFEEEEEEEEDAVDEVRDEMSEEEGKEEADANFQIESKLEADATAEDDKDKLDPRDIDAFWLQRQLSTFYPDAPTCHKMAEDVLGLLSNLDIADRAAENKLVLLLDYDKFDFIKLLLKNRLAVVFAVKLARAQDEAARVAIEQEMLSNAKLVGVLEALKKTAKHGERQVELKRALIKEARSLHSKKAEAPKNKLETVVWATKEGHAPEDPYWQQRPKTVLDLESLKLRGNHTMSNKECKLPQRSTVIDKKNYQEIHVPPLKALPFKKGEKLVKISQMPKWMQPAFSKMQQLTRVQSRCYETAFKTGENMLVCAPTGAGKTNVALLTIMRELGLHRRKDGSIDKDAFKVVYVAPMKSLVQEMVSNFGNRLKSFGLVVRELSGDVQLTRQQIQETQLIVTTPEKWDIITRKSGDRTYTELVKLLIIDEIHLLHDNRGPVLESLVARTIRQVENSQNMVRMVALSATLPNYEDVAVFLRVKVDKGLFFFDNSFRPVPLQQQFVGITQRKAYKRHQLMNEIVYEKIADQLEQNADNQVLVFVHTRKETANTAMALRDMSVEKVELERFVAEGSARKEMLASEAQEVSNDKLKELLPFGFGIHHAGMTRSDRELVEDLFHDRHLKVLVSTATLAWGVNLPAHCVIIKGTQVYSPEQGHWVELSPLDVLQMMGRAGRPQFDEMGEGILITSREEMRFYLSLLNEQLPVESQFVSRLADQLNAEVVLGSIHSVQEAVRWLGYTYLFVRMLRNPALYGVDEASIDHDPTLEQRRVDLVHSAAVLLAKNNLMKYDRKSGVFQMTDLGRVASHYYITYDSMATYNEYLRPTMSDIEVFRVFSQSAEFKHMTVREEEKLELAKLLDKVPIPVKEGIEEPSAKTNVLLQSYISRLKLDGFSLCSDMVYITQSAGRIMRALFEITLKRNWAVTSLRCLELCKMIQRRMWGAQTPLRQFSGLPSDVLKRLEAKTDWTWERLCDLEPHALGELVRVPRLGKKIHRSVHQLPKVELEASVQPITRSMLRVELTISPDFQFNERHGHAEPFWVVVEGVDGEIILHYEYFLLKKRFAEEEHTLRFTVPIHDPLPPQYFVRVVSDRWLGSCATLALSFRHLILPERNLPPTELLDLQPLMVSEVANERFIKLFLDRFDCFNAIQTQVFQTVFRSDTNTLIAAPTGSGKTVCAELALLRMLSQNPKGRAVYVVSKPELAKTRYIEWKARLSTVLGLKVVLLTGDSSTDLRLLREGQVVVSSAEAWDVLSRRWNTRKNVQSVSLVIVDELHLVGGENGPTLEVVVSRMRYISSQMESKIRIVGLSAPVANAVDLGEWIGATSSSLFNFHPNVRPVPLEIRIQGFDINHFRARQLAMTKPTFGAILHHSPQKPALVFVPSRKEVRRVAVDLMALAAAQDTHNRFLLAEESDIAPHVEKVHNSVLRKTLMVGIGFIHKGVSEVDSSIVLRLYEAGALQVVVVEYSLCWSLSLAAHLVVLMGLQYYDGHEHRYVDCALPDVLQMMGRACRPSVDESGKCVILCHAAKKEFYKKFLYEPFPVESHLDHVLSDHLNTEVVTKRAEVVQDCMDYLTWTLFYRRLTQNPNYYNMQGISPRHLNEHLSELVETTLEDLTNSQCVSMEGTELAPLNLGMIAAYYYIHYTTVERFARTLSAKSRLRHLVHILSEAYEFETVPVRHHEDYVLERLARHLPLKLAEPSFTSPHTKTAVLLQCHFSRVQLSAAAGEDQKVIVPVATRLLQAMVDVISSNGWLKPAVAAMELAQMLIQALWRTDSPLMQVPHMTPELVKKLEASGVNSLLDFVDLEEEDIRQVFKHLPERKLGAVASFVNTFPSVDLKFEVKDAGELCAGAPVTIAVQLTREEDEDEDEDEEKKKENPVLGVPTVVAPLYPTEKNEGWWLVVGNTEKNELLAIKRTTLSRQRNKVLLEFSAPSQGKHDLVLYLMSDSYIGIDQEYELTLDVGEGVESSSEEEEEEEDEDKMKE